MTSNLIPDPPGKVLAMLDADPPVPELYTPDLIERLPLDDVTARLGELGVPSTMPDRVRELVESEGGPAGHLISLLDSEEVILVRNPQPTPEDQVLWRSERDRLLQHLRARDADAGRMAELMLVEGLRGPELAEGMGLEQHKTDNIKKRLRRLVAAYVEADGEGSRRAAE
jgi:hypothetical protein